MVLTATDIKYGSIYLPRWDAEITVAFDGSSQWFPVKRMCAILGVRVARQRTVIRRRYPGAIRDDILYQTRGGNQATLWIRRKECTKWIDNINPLRCEITKRGTLQEFQDDLSVEADRLLFSPAAKSAIVDRGVLATSSRQEILFACPDCGSTHRIIIINGNVHVDRETH